MVAFCHFGKDERTMSKHLNRDPLQEASAAVVAAEDRLSRLRERFTDLQTRQRAASQAMNLASSAHRSALGDRELAENPPSEAELGVLREARRDAIHVEEGLALASGEISGRIQAAERDLVVCKHVLLEARIRDRCGRYRMILGRVLEIDKEAAGFLPVLRALLAEVEADRAALWLHDHTNVVLPDYSGPWRRCHPTGMAARSREAPRTFACWSGEAGALSRMARKWSPLGST
jgi:hypothetical protein